MRRPCYVLAAVALLIPAGPAGADVGGQVNGPELCTYPSVGVTVAVNPGFGQAVAQFCRWPQEINGAYYVDGYGLYTTSGSGGAGGFGINLSAGGGGGLTGYFCLDNPYHPTVFLPARDPNPPAAWKNRITPEVCEPLDLAPVAIPGRDTTQPAPAPDQQFATGAPTNPAGGNPDTTENPH